MHFNRNEVRKNDHVISIERKTDLEKLSALYRKCMKARSCAHFGVFAVQATEFKRSFFCPQTSENECRTVCLALTERNECKLKPMNVNSYMYVR